MTSNSNKSQPIGVFDSGMGGLTVLKALHEYMPNESYIYLGDTARLPYGTKSEQAIQKYSKFAVDQLIAMQVKMIIIACNSATVSALDYLRSEYPNIPIIGVVEPGVLAITKATKSNNIGIIATERTIQSGCYVQQLKKINADYNIYTQPCNIFASLAEEGHIDDDIANLVIKKYLNNLTDVNNSKIDTLLLGCTHFPVFRNTIQNIIPKTIAIVDSANTTALYAKELLDNNNLNYSLDDPNSAINSVTRYYVTDSPVRFAEIGKIFLGQEIIDINLI